MHKNVNDFQIIFAYYIFLSFNTGLFPGVPHISSPQVSVRAYSNVSLKCEGGVRPSDCWDNSLQWYFNNSVKLESGQKYDIQERTTSTKCKKDFILTIVNVTEADEGGYKCQWLCDKYYPSQSKSSTIQLKVYPPSVTGTETPVISKGLVSRNLSKFKKWKTPPNWVKHESNRSKINRILVFFGQMCNFRDPNLVAFYFYELTHFLDWMKNTLLFICSTNILVRLLTINMENCLTPKNRKMCDPILFNPVLKMGPQPAAHPH